MYGSAYRTFLSFYKFFFEELLMAVKEAKTQVETRAKENIKKCNSIGRDCMTLEKAEKDLETAQGDETEKLNSKKEELGEKRQKTNLYIHVQKRVFHAV